MYDDPLIEIPTEDELVTDDLIADTEEILRELVGSTGDWVDWQGQLQE